MKFSKLLRVWAASTLISFLFVAGVNGVYLQVIHGKSANQFNSFDAFSYGFSYGLTHTLFFHQKHGSSGFKRAGFAAYPGWKYPCVDAQGNPAICPISPGMFYY